MSIDDDDDDENKSFPNEITVRSKSYMERD